MITHARELCACVLVYNFFYSEHGTRSRRTLAKVTESTADETKDMGNGIVRGGLNVVVMPVGERENGDGERVQCEQATNGGLTSVTTLSCSSGDSGGGVAGVAGADQSASSTSTGL